MRRRCRGPESGLRNWSTPGWAETAQLNRLVVAVLDRAVAHVREPDLDIHRGLLSVMTMFSFFMLGADFCPLLQAWPPGSPDPSCSQPPSRSYGACIWKKETCRWASGRNTNQVRIPEAFTGRMPAEVVEVDLAGNHIVPVCQHLIQPSKPKMS